MKYPITIMATDQKKKIQLCLVWEYYDDSFEVLWWQKNISINWKGRKWYANHLSLKLRELLLRNKRLKETKDRRDNNHWMNIKLQIKLSSVKKYHLQQEESLNALAKTSTFEFLFLRMLVDDESIALSSPLISLPHGRSANGD